MKHLFLFFAALCALLLVLVLGASVFLKSTVEDMAREAILSMTSPGEAVLEDVVFSPLTRELTITGWRARHQTDRGAVSTLAPTMRGQVTFRGVFACMPVLGDLVNDADSFVPVLANLKGEGISWSGSDHRVRTGTIEWDTLSLRYGLLQQYSLGLRPPFAQGLAGIRIGRVDMTDLELGVFTRTETFDVHAERVTVREVDGGSAANVRIHNLIWKESAKGGGWAMSGSEVVFEDVRFSPALVSELVALSAGHGQGRERRSNGQIGQGSQQLSQQLMDALAANGPVVARTRLKNLALLEGEPAFTLESCDLVWSDGPSMSMDEHMNLEAHVRGLQMSPIVLELLDWDFVSTENLQEIVLDADLVSSGLVDGRETGLVRVKALGELSWDVLWHRENNTVSDVSLTFRDFGFMARVARTISPDPHASSMLLKASAQSLCQNDSAPAKESCRRLADFVDAPGTLSIKGRFQSASLIELALGAMAGRFGSFFAVETHQGSRSLTRQSEDIFTDESFKQDDLPGTRALDGTDSTERTVRP